jgi:hypothetical protein
MGSMHLLALSHNKEQTILICALGFAEQIEGQQWHVIFPPTLPVIFAVATLLLLAFSPYKSILKVWVCNFNCSGTGFCLDHASKLL